MTSIPGYRFVIIGNGAAGVAAVEGIRRHNLKDRILIISKEGERFYSKPGLAYWLLGQIPEKQLYPRAPIADKNRGVERLHGEAAAIDPDRRLLKLEDGRQLRFDKLLIATGARAVRPSVEGIDLKGVVALDSLEETRAILKQARTARRAVVVGGGITALELAEGLAARRVETHYLLRKDRYWGSVLDETESRLVEERLKEEGIRLHHNVEIRQIVARRNRVAGVVLNTGEVLPCDMVGIAVGTMPQTALTAGTAIQVDRGIIVDETFRTSVEGVYAAGDVAQVWDPDAQQHVLDSLWGVAREQGFVAGINMGGVRESYRRKVPFNVTRIGCITTTLIGCIGQPEKDGDLVAIARGDSETWRYSGGAYALKQESEGCRIRLLVGARTIRGALIMGDQDLSRPLQHMIVNKVDISPIRAQLLENPKELVELLQRFWSERERKERG